MGLKGCQTSRNSKNFATRRFLIFILPVISILAIVIVVAVMFGRKKNAAMLKSDVLVPLYVYPLPAAWDPLFTA